ncbi:MAG TPA: metallophosphoesterase [Phycisphaerae bacterium]|nr:metallophosphoesterase [Phycisphaerae bacterium]
MNSQITRREVNRAVAVRVLVGVVVFVLQAPTYAFEILNETSSAMRAIVPEGDFDEIIPPNEARSCNWRNGSCNPTGTQTGRLTLIAQTLDGSVLDFAATVDLMAGGRARIRQQSRDGMNILPNFYVDSWDVTGTQRIDDTRLGIDESDRHVRFLVTADCQYQNHDGDRKAVADATASQMQSFVDNPQHRIRGILVAGDLTQWARVDEWEDYCDSIRGYEEFYYDGLGNHDLLNVQNFWEIESCFYSDDTAPWCAIPETLADTIRNRRHRTTKTAKAPGVAPHYSWDWHDVHFVQLNLFPGDGPTDDPLATDGAGYDPANALSFLIDDLAAHVGGSGRPIVLVHHYGFDPFSTGDHWWSDSERLAYWNALAPYNVAGIFTGHTHLKESDTTWRYDWKRPAEAEAGPDEIPTFVSGASLFGVYVDVTIFDDDRMRITRRASDGRAIDAETVLFGQDDLYDRTVANDSCDSAYPLFEFGEEISDLRIVGDDEDWFSITVPGQSRLRVDATFANDIGNIDLSLYTDCNAAPIRSATGDTDNESVTWTNPGADTTVCIRVMQRAGETRTIAYDLSVAVGDDAFEENDTCAAATILDEGNYSDLTLSNDDEDWYRITAPAATKVSVGMQGLSQALDLEFEIREDCESGPVLYGVTNGVIKENTYINDGPARDIYVRALAQGHLGRERYELFINFVALSTPSCSHLPVTPPGFYSSLNVYDGLDDWYRIESVNGAATTVTVDYDHSNGNIDLEFWRACHFARFQTSSSHDNRETLSYEGDGFGDDFYVRVRMADPGGYNQYTLSVTNRSVVDGADDCADAMPISGTRDFIFNNTDATTDGQPDALCNFSGNNMIYNDVWFDWTSTLTGRATLSICPSLTTLDTKVAVYEGTNCVGDILVCNDDACDLKSEVEFDAVAGGEYKIRVGSYVPGDGQGGHFAISVEDAYGPLDDCSDAPPLAPGLYSDLVLGVDNGPGGIPTDYWATMVPGNTRLTVDVLYDDGVVFDPAADFSLHRPNDGACPGPSWLVHDSAIPGGTRFRVDNHGNPQRYYFRVRNTGDEYGFNYALRISQSTIDDQFEPNDACDSPATLTTGFHDELRCSNEDYYAIPLPATAILDVAALFAQADGDLSLLLCRTCGEPIVVSNSENDDEFLEYINTGPAETVILRVTRADASGLVPYALDVSVTDFDDCNGNTLDDNVEIAEQLADDCNGNGIPDECDIRNTRLVSNNTGVDDAVWLGTPDGVYAGVGSDRVLYDLSETARVFDGPGSDFNIYEFDRGGSEFNRIRVYAGLNQFNLVDITATEAPVVRISGDEAHGDNAFARSYDISASGYSRIRYIAIDGNDGLGDAGAARGFDLDAIGLIYVGPTGCPVHFDADMNCDGVVDLQDVSLFSRALVDPASYAFHELSCPIQRADVNRNGAIDGNDTPGFIELLTAP